MALTALPDVQDWLPDYLRAVRTLLHDASAAYYPDSTLAGYINDGRRQVALSTACLRTLDVVTLPGAQSAFPIGGVYDLQGVTAPPGWDAPFSLVSGGGGAATCSVAATPATITVTAPGTYYLPPRVLLDGGISSLNLSIDATAVLTGTSLSAIYVNSDSGAFAAAGVTPAVTLIPQGLPAQLTVGAADALSLATAGSGQAQNVVLTGASAGSAVFQALAPGAASVLDASIAAINQVSAIWGAMRYPLRPMAFSQLSAELRSLVGYQQVPQAFAMYANTLYLAPTPSQPLQYELDTLRYPAALADYVTMGPITDASARNGVPYWAAYRAKLGEGDANAAGTFLQLYQQAARDAVNRYTTYQSAPYPWGDD